MKNWSVSLKLTLLFVSAIAVSMVIGGFGLWAGRTQDRLDDAMRQAYVGRAWVEKINGLVYAVVMDSRGVYMSEKPEALKKYADGMAVSLDRMTATVAEWEKEIDPALRGRFDEMKGRVAEFRDFRTEMARRGIAEGLTGRTADLNGRVERFLSSIRAA